MVTFGALCHVMGPEKQTGMLCKKKTDDGKEERGEVEMELVSILDNSSETVEKIDEKLSKLNENSVSKMQDKLKKIKDQMKQD